MEHFSSSPEHSTTSVVGLNQNNTNAEILMNTIRLPFLAALLLIMISMGCTIELKKLWAHLRRPWTLAVGVVCQFGFMPLIAFILAIFFKLKPLSAIAVIIMGSCPGGIISNVMSYWTDGDMDLSISMTVCSTILAIGFMPLSLYIYSTAWTLEFNNSSTVPQMPYKQIGSSLVTLIIPISLGIFMARKWPRQSKLILKIGTGLGAFILIVSTVAITLLYNSKWSADSTLLIIGILNPLLGYTVGFILAMAVRQSWASCRTIALETGAQNGHLCTTILMISFSMEELSSMFAYPFIYICFQIFHGLMFVTAYQMYKRFKRGPTETMDSTQSTIRGKEINDIQSREGNAPTECAISEMTESI
ncbi:sodium-dependent organic anion transporter-like [Stegostoma tigrinum]|uniref:sodium-dependent organic anion transporter-like n=1 Tax=Stegostoma tigrinum TaxID=3053191 RepID=UPI00202B8F3B|nr:sodium-dependent organic anion transporter-like [Stegostoma tigrinum]